ncbi:hypothetical protein C1H46_007343 [Malus baccata]|uniref:CCR4-Not complex component Not1 C-terminal domain-containing protein n=1 Tax=Malus baccata TaxID=106549 RepID=A0A540N7N7_MALBA|nr:hypothetical protein C1H46_007343 [Malus baccata]
MWDSTIRYDTENRWCGRSTIDRHRVNAGESSRCTVAAALPAANDDQACAHLRISLCRCSLCPFANFLVPMQLAACAHFILQLHQSGLLKGNDMTDRFFCVFTELSVAYCLSSEMTIPGSVQTPQQVQNIFFLAIDIYAKLVFLILKAIQQLQARMPQCAIYPNCSIDCPLVGAALDIFQTLIVDLDTEGRYLFLNATANLLRYPNTHTHYVSFIVLYLFAESNPVFLLLQHEIIQEQITRVLLERLIANHLIHGVFGLPWLSLSRIRCAPEIEKLFGSVSRSCGGPKPVDEGHDLYF